MSKRTLFLIFVLIVVVSLLSFMAVLQSVERTHQMKQDVSTQAPTPTTDPSLIPDTTLSSSPSATLVKQGVPTTFDILVNTGQNTLTTTQIEIGFEPEFLDVVKIEAGPFFSPEAGSAGKDVAVLINEIDRKTGRATLVLGTITGQKGTGLLARITVVGKKPTAPSGKATSLIFLPKTQVLGNSNRNLSSLIKQTQGSQIVIVNE